MSAQITGSNSRLPYSGSLISEVREFHPLIRFLMQRELTIRFRRTWLGVCWVIVQPLAFAALFYAIVSARSEWFPELSAATTFATMYLGLSLWQYFESSTTGAANSFVAHSQLLKSVCMPRRVLIIAAVLVKLPDLVINVALLISIMLISGATVPLAWALGIPCAVLMLCLFSFGLGLSLATLNVYRRDIKHALPIAMRFMFIASPFWYSLNNLPAWLAKLMILNPVVVALELVKQPFQKIYSLQLLSFLPSIILIAATIFFGKYIFTRLNDQLADSL